MLLLAEPAVALQEMVESQPEVALGFDRELNSESLTRRLSAIIPASRASIPSAPTTSPLHRRDSSSRRGFQFLRVLMLRNLLKTGTDGARFMTVTRRQRAVGSRAALRSGPCFFLRRG